MRGEVAGAEGASMAVAIAIDGGCTGAVDIDLGGGAGAAAGAAAEPPRRACRRRLRGRLRCRRREEMCSGVQPFYCGCKET